MVLREYRKVALKSCMANRFELVDNDLYKSYWKFMVENYFLLPQITFREFGNCATYVLVVSRFARNWRKNMANFEKIWKNYQRLIRITGVSDASSGQSRYWRRRQRHATCYSTQKSWKMHETSEVNPQHLPSCQMINIRMLLSRKFALGPLWEPFWGLKQRNGAIILLGHGYPWAVPQYFITFSDFF